MQNYPNNAGSANQPGYPNPYPPTPGSAAPTYSSYPSPPYPPPPASSPIFLPSPAGKYKLVIIISVLTTVVVLIGVFLLGGLWLSASQLHLARSYKGEIINATVKESAPLEIDFTSTDPNNLTGRISITGPYLIGSGSFSGGKLQGNAITFEVTPSDGAYSTLNFTGTLYQDSSLKGNYFVPPSGPIIGQSGTWDGEPF